MAENNEEGGSSRKKRPLIKGSVKRFPRHKENPNIIDRNVTFDILECSGKHDDTEESITKSVEVE